MLGFKLKDINNPFKMRKVATIVNLDKYVERLHFIVTDLLTNQMRYTINQMDDKIFQSYLKYNFSIYINV